MPAFLKKAVVYILTLEAQIVLARHKPKIIAVTGSVGKTTTKDAIYAAISPHAYVRKSQKSLNSDIGVPLTILGLDNAWRDPIGWVKNVVVGMWRALFDSQYPQWLVLEVGADRPGDIRSIAKWLRPDIAVITGVPDIPVHVEYFSSPDDVMKEKKALVEYLRHGGKAILNGDEPRTRALKSEYRGASILYGLENSNDFYASHVKVSYKKKRPAGMQFRLNHQGSQLPIGVYGALGNPRVYAALAALAVADVVGIDNVSAASSLEGWEPPPGRMRLIDGIKGSIIIDDTYNSSPVAAHAALDTLKEVNATRRVAILGDMLELGRYTAEAHREVGKHAAESCDFLITVGIRSRSLADSALDAGLQDRNIRQYENGESRRAAQELAAEVQEGDVILVKGSQSMRMERTVEELMEKPAEAKDLLVRQEEEWMHR